jgi:hypothetical protein
LNRHVADIGEVKNTPITLVDKSESNHLEDLVIDGRIILNCILKWDAFTRPKIVTGFMNTKMNYHYP